MNNRNLHNRVSSNTRWILRRELKSFIMLLVWMFGLRKLWKDCFLPLHNNILKYWRSNGSLWLTQYLAAASRIIVFWVSGQPYTDRSDSVRVRLTRGGLPVFLPASLRALFYLIRTEDHARGLLVIRVTLSILSVYRVIGCGPNLKMSTITGAFSGVSSTLPEWEVSQAVSCCLRVLLLAVLSGSICQRVLDQTSKCLHGPVDWMLSLSYVPQLCCGRGFRSHFRQEHGSL
jgi:hypothetical protein